MWPGFDTASRIYDWANVWLIAALVLGAASTGLVVWMGNVKESYLRRELAQTTERTEKLRAENLLLQKTLVPRRIAMTSRDGDAETRKARFAEVAKFAGTLALIQSVPDFEAQILASDIGVALRNSGWNVQIMDQTQSHISPGLIMQGVSIVTLEAPLFTGDGTDKSPFVPNPHPPSRAGEAAQTIVNLLTLDLGPPRGPNFFGVHWAPEYTGDATPSLLVRQGFKFPDNRVVVLVGMKPMDAALQPIGIETKPPGDKP